MPLEQTGKKGFDFPKLLLIFLFLNGFEATMGEGERKRGGQYPERAGLEGFADAVAMCRFERGIG